MTRITITLERTERAALQQLAAQERREPKAQAAILIRKQLENLGWLKPTTPPTQEDTNDRL